MLIKIGLRKNLLYPCFFILFLFLRQIAKSIIEIMIIGILEKDEIALTFLMLAAIYLVQLILGIIRLLFIYLKTPNKPTNEENQEKKKGLILIQSSEKLESPDSVFKIFVLIFFAAFFEIVGAITRRCFKGKENVDTYDEYHAKFRCIELCFASILCFFIFHIQILKHQLFSVLIILICLIIVLIFDFNKENDLLINVGNIIISSFCRVYLDVIEKYLFDYDFLELYQIMAYEGIVNSILTSILYISDKPRKEIRQIFKMDKFYIFFTFFFVFIYAILSWFKNIYRRFTIKFYYPMTRALAESVLDPILIIYDNCFFNSYEENSSFIVTLSCSIITIFCSCIYNEVFILYCCGLEHETHYEITYRSKTIEIPNKNEVSAGSTDDFDNSNNISNNNSNNNNNNSNSNNENSKN